MTTTVQTKTGGETPIPKLTAIVLLAQIARDNGIDWPREVRFMAGYDHICIDFDTPAELTAWSNAVGASAPRPRTVGKHVYHDVHAHAWHGWTMYLACVEPVAAMDDETSAALDDLVAAVQS